MASAHLAWGQSITIIGGDVTYFRGDTDIAFPTVQVSCGGALLDAAFDIRIRHASGVGVVWDDTASASIANNQGTGAGVAAFPGSNVYTDGDRTLNITVVDDFDSTQAFNINSLRVDVSTLATLGGNSLGMDHFNDPLPADDDAFTGAQVIVASDPTISSGANQLFFVGQGPAAISPITITETNGNGLRVGRQVHIVIPAGFSMDWATGDTSATITPLGGGTGTFSPVVSYIGSKTLVLTVTANFTDNRQVVISDLSFQNFGAIEAPDNLRLRVNNNTSDRGIDTQQIQIRGNPNISAASQGFTVNDPPSNCAPITITDANGAPTILTTTDIRIRIPASLQPFLQWVTTTPTLTVTGAAADKMEGSFSAGTTTMTLADGDYSISSSTVTLQVGTNFAAGDTIIVNGLQFQNFGTLVGTVATGAPATQLELDTDNGGTQDDPDPAASVVIGAPQILSSSPQIVIVDDENGIQQITITAGATSARITEETGIRIRIPAGTNATWDPSDLNNANLGGAGANNCDDDLSIEPGTGNKVLIITVDNGDFAAGEVLTITGPTLLGGNTSSLPQNLELIIRPLTEPAGSAVCDLDNEVIAVGGLPTLSSGGNQTFARNDPPQPAQTITIQDSPGFASITTGNDLRIRIPASFDMTWDQTDLSATIDGLNPGRITGAGPGNVGVSYQNAGKVLVINVAQNFQNTTNGESFTISGLTFAFPNGGSAEPIAPQLELIVDGSPNGVTADVDDATIGIGAPTITTASQVFGTNDPATPIAQITVAEDGAVPTIRQADGIRIRIPSTGPIPGLTWLTSDTVVTFGGNPATVAKVTGASFIDNKNLQIALNADFVATDSLIIATGTAPADNLQFVPGNAEVAAQSLDLLVRTSLSTTHVAATTAGTLIVSNRPSILAVTTGDLNANGVIDRVVVEFSEDLLDASPSIGTAAGLALTQVSISVGTESPPRFVTYVVVETGTPNTGITPTLSYDPVTGEMFDLNGLEPLANPGIVALDGAPPRIIQVSAPNNTTVVFTFSEPIGGVFNAAHWQIVDPNGTNLLPLVIANVIAGNQLTLTLNVPHSGGIPRFVYNGNSITDLAGVPNPLAFQSNNNAPFANAGADISTPPTRVTLNGQASTDPDNQPLSFSWAPTGGPAFVSLTGASTPNPTFVANVPGVYTFGLQVNDGLATANDTVAVTILNAPPTAHAGFDQTVLSGAIVGLNAGASLDVNAQLLSFTWQQTDGPPVVLSNPNIPNPTFNTAAVFGTLGFTVTVSDGIVTASDSCVVRVNLPGNAVPTAHAGGDVVVFVGTSARLNGGLSRDPEDAPLDFAWSPADNLVGPATMTPQFTPPVAGIFEFDLVVSAGGMSSAPDRVRVIAISPSNLPPTAVASKVSPAGDVLTGTLVTLGANGSADPEGSALVYSWSQAGGPFALLVNPSSAQPSFHPISRGTYTFELVVGDGFHSSVPAQVTVQVKDTAAQLLPDAIAALSAASDPDGDGRVTAASVGLTGAASTGTGLTFAWEQKRGPAVVVGFTLAAPTFTHAGPGVYEFLLTVTDGGGVRDFATVAFIVDAANVSPTANAGADRSASAGQPVLLDGNASSDPAGDADAVTTFGTGLTAFWSQVSGPPAVISDPYSNTPTVTTSAAGTYVFQLVVKDGVADSAPDSVTIASGAAAGGGGGGGGGGGCGIVGLEPLLFVWAVMGVAALARRRRSVR